MDILPPQTPQKTIIKKIVTREETETIITQETTETLNTTKGETSQDSAPAVPVTSSAIATNDTHIVSKTEATDVANTLYGEIRSGTLSDAIAVMWVIENRRRSGKWGESYTSVVKAPKQFSCWNTNDNNFAVIQETPQNSVLKKLNVVDYQKCMLAFFLVVLNFFPDPTEGALHYSTKNISPAWAKAASKTIDIGPHRFYVGVEV